MTSRRQLITLLGGAAIAPLHSLRAARAQDGRVRKIGWLSGGPAEDSQSKARLAAFRDGLRRLGWVDGRNIRIEARWGEGDATRLQPLVVDLIRSQPDVIFASANSALSALHRDSTTIPIVFAQVPDPVGAGYVSSLSRPGGHITGFALYEFAVGLKWLELLKELAPQTGRVAVIYEAANPSFAGYLSSIKGGAQTFGVEVSPLPMRDGTEFERAMESFAREPNGGLIVLPAPLVAANRDKVAALANKLRLPAVCPYRYFLESGGLAFYGVDEVDLHRQAASYVDRILKGEKAGDLPVQFSTKFELVINLKTATALGLEPSISLLARTDEVIE